MSVSASLQKSMTRGLDAVSSITQHLVMIAGLLLLLGIASFIFKDEAEKDVSSAEAALPSESAAVSATDNAGLWSGIAEAHDVSSLTPHLAGTLEYVKRRYRVSPDAVRPIFRIVELIGQERRIDPLLILAIIGIESGFNPFAESSMGARGLMQVIPRFHMDKFPEGMGVQHLFDPAVNIQVGVRVLEDAIRRRGGIMEGLQYYAGSSDSRGGYANKVLAEKARLEKAAGRTRTEPGA